jgi:N-acetyl-anhydromuramyl-L-alanine amidase AmpD
VTSSSSVPPPGEPRIVAAASYMINHRPASLRNYSRVVRTPTLIVLHCTDGHEGVHKDTDVAAIFADPNLPEGQRRSAGWIVDSDSVTCCVADQYVAWHCGHEGNMRGIGIELCGRAAQSRREWFDELSLPMLCIAARLVADKCREWSIPAAVVNARGLVAGESGITTHSFVTDAWHQTKHHDPGPGFPLGKFVRAVGDALALLAPPSSPIV